MGNETLYSHSYEIRGMDFINAGRVSSAIKETLKSLGVPAAIIRRMAIASFEAEMNVVCYAEEADCELIVTNDFIKVVFDDRGKGIADVDLAMKEGYSTATDLIREMGFGAGIGLPNIKKNSDRMKIESVPGKGTRIEFLVNRNGRSDT